MFAVIRTGGKQYRVAPNDVIHIEHIAGEPGDVVELDEVLMLGGDDPKAGAPLVEGAVVAAEVVEQTRGDKIRVFKKKRRSNYRRTAGHRQLLTALRITEILTDGKKPAKAKPAAKPEAKKADTKTEAVEAKAEVKTEIKAAEKLAAKAEAKAETKTEAKKPAAKKAEAKPAAKKAEAKDEKPAAKKAPARKPAAKKSDD